MRPRSVFIIMDGRAGLSSPLRTELSIMAQKPATDPNAAKLAALKREHHTLYREECRRIPRTGEFRPDYFYTLFEVADKFVILTERLVREDLERRGCQSTRVAGRLAYKGSWLIDALEREPCDDDTPESGQPS